jgi:hypothetical protein
MKGEVLPALLVICVGVPLSVLATYLALRRAGGARERRFIMRSMPWFSGFVVGATMLVLYRPGLLSAGICSIGLLVGNLWWNRRQKAIRRVEELQRQQSS